MKKILTATLLTLSLAIYAASSFTPHFDLELPADGDANWGDAYRSSLTTIDSQMYINQQSIADHISDTAGAHSATAISAASGATVCVIADDVQEYLDCLDAQLGIITGGTLVTTNTNQTLTGQKTFTQSILANAGLTGNVTGNVTGDVTGNLTGNVTGNLTGNVTGTASGNVTSIGLSVPATSIFGVTGSPVTTSGTIDITTTGTQGGLPYFSSTSQLTSGTAGTSGYVLTSGGTGAYTWTDPASLGSTATLQDVYDNSTPARFILNSTQGPFSIRDANTSIVNLFEVTSIAGSQYFLVTPSESVFGTNVYTTGGITVDNGVRFQDAANAFGITIIQPTMAADYTFTLPADDGASGEVLTTDGSGILTWEAPVVGVPTYNAYAVDTTLTEQNDQYVVCSGSGTDITLFACGASQAGKKVSIKRNDASNACTIVPNSGGTADRIDGTAGSKAISVNLQSFTLVCDGSDDWYIF